MNFGHGTSPMLSVGFDVSMFRQPCDLGRTKASSGNRQGTIRATITGVVALSRWLPAGK